MAAGHPASTSARHGDASADVGAVDASNLARTRKGKTGSTKPVVHVRRYDRGLFDRRAFRGRRLKRGMGYSISADVFDAIEDLATVRRNRYRSTVLDRR